MVSGEAKKLSRMSGMKFNVASVKKPLASAVKVVEARNRISMGLHGTAAGPQLH